MQISLSKMEKMTKKIKASLEMIGLVLQMGIIYQQYLKAVCMRIRFVRISQALKTIASGIKLRTSKHRVKEISLIIVFKSIMLQDAMRLPLNGFVRSPKLMMIKIQNVTAIRIETMKKKIHQSVTKIPMMEASTRTTR